MKIYARQIPPEYQESPLFNFDFPENVHVYGNKNYKEHGNHEKTVENINYFYEDIEGLRNGLENDTEQFKDCNLNAILRYYFPRENPYTRTERLQFLDILDAFFRAPEYSDEETRALISAMELRDGIKYEYSTIRGSCQGDWQHIIYPAEYGENWLACFEIEYFNTGSQWMVHDGDNEPDTPEDIDGFCVYCHEWRTEDIKKEIANEYGEPGAEVILYEFSGYTRIATYTEV